MTVTPFRVAITRDVIVATGKDARTFLHSQLSNDIAGLAVGAVTHAFILDPSGKLNAFFRVRCFADDHFVLDVDAGCGTAALARLNKFKIRVQCDFVLTTEEVVAIRGVPTGLEIPGTVPAWRRGDGAFDVFVSGAEAPLADIGELRIGAAPIRTGTDAEFHAERVRCAWPMFGIDITDASLPAETGLVDVAVSFTKGCYPGQELVERMDSRGSTAPRTLMRLPSRMPATADSGEGSRAVAGQPYLVAANEATVEIGMCTSVAGDYALVLVARAQVPLVTAEGRSQTI